MTSRQREEKEENSVYAVHREEKKEKGQGTKGAKEGRNGRFFDDRLAMKRRGRRGGPNTSLCRGRKGHFKGSTSAWAKKKEDTPLPLARKKKEQERRVEHRSPGQRTSPLKQGGGKREKRRELPAIQKEPFHQEKRVKKIRRPGQVQEGGGS